ncbi:transposase [Nonomuraea sp. NPDC059194]|uniref:transposase n=1 Tax=Nonomuraea sp. NPDC059194 TaxID=3346764 RepID=UPI0036CC6D28
MAGPRPQPRPGSRSDQTQADHHPAQAHHTASSPAGQHRPPGRPGPDRPHRLSQHRDRHDRKGARTARRSPRSASHGDHRSQRADCRQTPGRGRRHHPFRSSAAFARHNGTAPIPVWSGNDDRHRLNRGGNRQLNTTLHRIAITQARCHEGARALLKRRQETTRDTTKGSFRVLKRHLSDVIYRALIADHHAHNNGTSTGPQ